MEDVGFGKEELKKLRALGGAWASPLKVEVTQNDGRVWEGKKRRLTLGKTKQNKNFHKGKILKRLVDGRNQ